MMKKIRFMVIFFIMLASSNGFATSLAQRLFDQSEYTGAALEWNSRLSIMRQQGASSEDKLFIINKLVSTYQQLGWPSRSVTLLKEGIKLTENNPPDSLKLDLYLRASNLLQSIGALEDASAFAKTGLDIALQLKRPRLLVSAYITYANIQTVAGDLKKAEIAYQRAIKLSEQHGFAEIRVKAMANQTHIYLFHQNTKAASVQILKTFEAIKSLTASQQAEQNLVVGSLFKRMPDSLSQALSDASQQALNQAARYFVAQKKYRSASFANGYLGLLYELEQQPEDALKLSQRAIFYAEQNNDADILYRWLHLKGRLLVALNQPEAALLAYRHAIKILDPIRDTLDTGYLNPLGSFAHRVKVVYYELADLLLQKAEKETNKVISQDLMVEARNVVELLKMAELEDYLQDDCVVRFRAKSTSLDKVEKTTAVLYPMIFKHRLVVMLSGTEGIHQVTVKVDAKTLTNTANLFRQNLQTRPVNHFLIQGKQLYDWLIGSVKPQLDQWGIDTLVIIPDGALRTIPFSTLHDGKQFLIENYAIATSPSIQLTDPQALTREGSKILLAGLSESVQGFAALPGVPNELSTIHGMIGGDKILNKDYSVDNFSKKIQENAYSIIHLATHGVFSGNREDSFLLSYDGKMNMDKLEAIIGFGQFRKQPLELLTLSACQTAMGDDRAALGLAGIAVKAGARSALATLWFVDDEATSLAMRDFYKTLFSSDKPSKAKALQTIQKRLIAQDRYWHPSYWGPFLLIGNWL